MLTLSTANAQWHTSMNRAREIIAEVAALHGLSVAKFLTPDRRRCRAHARWEAMARLRAADLSLPEIGQALGGMHHTSVIHGLRGLRQLALKRLQWMAIAPLARDDKDWVGRSILHGARAGRAELVSAGAGL